MTSAPDTFEQVALRLGDRVALIVDRDPDYGALVTLRVFTQDGDAAAVQFDAELMHELADAVSAAEEELDERMAAANRAADFADDERS